MNFSPGEITIISLVSGLLGSVLTVAITEVLKQRGAKKQHQYNLKEVFFKRKLEIAERAVMVYHESINQCILLEKYIDEGLRGGPSHAQFINESIDKVSRKMADIEERKEKLENADMLYFPQDFERLYSIEALNHTMEFSQIIHSLQDEINDGEFGSGGREEEILRKVEEAFDRLKHSLIISKNHLKDQIEAIYNDLGKYR